MKTKGKCFQCGKIYSSAKAAEHLLDCVHSSTAPDNLSVVGYLIHISDVCQPNLYWMLIALPRDTSLGQLDQFLRDIWMECCGHLSEFLIGARRYISHTASGDQAHL